MVPVIVIILIPNSVLPNRRSSEPGNVAQKDVKI